MPRKTFDVNLDLMNSKYQFIDGIEVVSGDTEANVFNINLLKDYQPVNVTGNTAVIVFSKPDRKIVYQNLIPIDLTTGKFTCTLSSQTIAVPGEVKSEVVLYEGTKRLTSTRFRFIVNKGLLDENAVESSNEFSALTEALGTLTSHLADNMQRAINIMNPPAPLIGCKGDGTDDRPRLQAIIDYAENLAVPVTLYVPKGYTFLLNSFSDDVNKYILVVNKYISWDGEGELKVADAFGDYYAICMYTQSGDSIRIENITINENSTGNPPNHDITTNPTWHRHVLKGPSHYNSIIIRNVKIIDTNPVTTIMFQNVDYQVIENCYIEYSKTVTPPVKYDNSAIWHCGKRGYCKNNIIIGNEKAVSAIEVHGENTTTSHNTIMCFDQGILLASNYNTMKNIIEDNKIINVIRGIIFWTDEQLGCSYFTVRNNYIFIHPFKGAEQPTLTLTTNHCQGIATRYTVDTPDIFKEWEIEGNTIEYYTNAYINTQNNSNGISIFLTLQNDTTDITKAYIKGLKIKGNTIKNPYAQGIGIYMNPNFTAPGDYLDDYDISNNYIVNPYNNYGGDSLNASNILSNTGSAIYFNSSANIRNLIISKNHISITCDSSLKGSHCNLLIDLRQIVSSGKDYIKVIDNISVIDSPILINTLYSKQSILFKGQLAEKDPMMLNTSYSYMLEGSEFVTSRGAKYRVSTQRVNERIARRALREEAGYGDAVTLNYAGFWFKSNKINNIAFDGTTSTILYWVCKSNGIVADGEWTANTYYAPNTLFTHPSYPGATFLVVVGGTSGATFSTPDSYNNTVDGTMVYQRVLGDYPQPTFATFLLNA